MYIFLNLYLKFKKLNFIMHLNFAQHPITAAILMTSTATEKVSKTVFSSHFFPKKPKI